MLKSGEGLSERQLWTVWREGWDGKESKKGRKDKKGD